MCSEACLGVKMGKCLQIQFSTLFTLQTPENCLQKTTLRKMFAKGTNDAIETNYPMWSHKISYELSRLKHAFAFTRRWVEGGER